MLIRIAKKDIVIGEFVKNATKRKVLIQGEKTTGIAAYY